MKVVAFCNQNKFKSNLNLTCIEAVVACRHMLVALQALINFNHLSLVFISALLEFIQQMCHIFVSQHRKLLSPFFQSSCPFFPFSCSLDSVRHRPDPRDASHRLNRKTNSLCIHSTQNSHYRINNIFMLTYGIIEFDSGD